MQCNGNFKQWFNIFLIISEAWQGYESKAYGVSNHNLKLQSKKLSRTRDIPNFPTQGWADTAFCTRKRSETYLSIKYPKASRALKWALDSSRKWLALLTLLISILKFFIRGSGDWSTKVKDSRFEVTTNCRVILLDRIMSHHFRVSIVQCYTSKSAI